MIEEEVFRDPRLKRDRHILVKKATFKNSAQRANATTAAGAAAARPPTKEDYDLHGVVGCDDFLPADIQCVSLDSPSFVFLIPK